MIAKTKKYKLDKKQYMKLGLMNILREQWWVIFIAIGIGCLTLIYPETIWFYIIAGAGLILYIVFWLIQFVGVTQLPQNSILFEKLAYEIDSRQILIKFTTKQGMPITWDQIKKAYRFRQSFILVISKGQLIHLPYTVFNSDNEVKFVEALLRRKNFIK